MFKIWGRKFELVGTKRKFYNQEKQTCNNVLIKPCYSCDLKTLPISLFNYYN